MTVGDLVQYLASLLHVPVLDVAQAIFIFVGIIAAVAARLPAATPGTRYAAILGVLDWIGQNFGRATNVEQLASIQLVGKPSAATQVVASPSNPIVGTPAANQGAATNA